MKFYFQVLICCLVKGHQTIKERRFLSWTYKTYFYQSITTDVKNEKNKKSVITFSIYAEDVRKKWITVNV